MKLRDIHEVCFVPSGDLGSISSPCCFQLPVIFWLQMHFEKKKKIKISLLLGNRVEEIVCFPAKTL